MSFVILINSSFPIFSMKIKNSSLFLAIKILFLYFCLIVFMSFDICIIRESPISDPYSILKKLKLLISKTNNPCCLFGLVFIIFVIFLIKASLVKNPVNLSMFFFLLIFVYIFFHY
jgi:hypothetical protein